jgi:glycosyltransferase involved in cell wall biosynthesis
MKNNKITFLVYTFNEERRIEPMLKCLYGHGEIILIDNCSEDNTINIAKRYTQKIYKHKNIGYVENEDTLKFSTDVASFDWLYLAYVDELIPKELMTLLKKISNEDKYDAVEIYRKNYMYGQEVFNYGKHHLRMFKKKAVSFKGNIVHKFGTYKINSNRVIKIKPSENTSLWHFSSYTTPSLEKAHNRYANIEANERFTILNQRFSGTKMFFKLFFYFFGTYFGLGGFRGGWPGFFISVQIAYYKFSIEARLWELENSIDDRSIEDMYIPLKNKIIQSYQNNNPNK